MKKLKLDHQLAGLVLKGHKTSTWRLFDDKDLTVNDEVILVDKVVPDKPATWRAIGVARINKVIEKRLGDIEVEDYQGHELHDSAEARLLAYRSYYGDRVSYDTPVKMLHFSFTPDSSQAAVQSDTSSILPGLTKVDHIILYADGGSRGNPGPSACGYVLLDLEENVLVDKGVYLGITTNNQAEYQGLKQALEEAKAMGAREVDVRLDSMLVINQMKGIFKVKNRDLWPIHDAVKELAASFRHISYTHVPRELNKRADTAVNRALNDVAAERRTDDGTSENRPVV